MNGEPKGDGNPLARAESRHPHRGEGRKQPPRPLEGRLPPSQRHPEGLPRCQRWDLVEGELWQCSKAARRGFRVCGVHGAGYPAREQRGEAKNPATAALTTGEHAQPETLKQLWQQHPEQRALYEHQLNSGELLDLRPQLAAAKVLAQYLADQVFDEPGEGKKPPSTLQAIDALNRVMQIAERLVSIEEKLGPITHAELRQYVQAVVQTIVRFIPAERQREAFDYLRAEALRANAAPEAEAGSLH